MARSAISLRPQPAVHRAGHSNRRRMKTRRQVIGANSADQIHFHAKTANRFINRP